MKKLNGNNQKLPPKSQKTQSISFSVGRTPSHTKLLLSNECPIFTIYVTPHNLRKIMKLNSKENSAQYN